MTYVYDGQFKGNILVVGKSGCGKTTFLETFFRDLVKTEWISGIDIDQKRKAKIQSCFSNETKVHVAKEPDELDLLIETFRLRMHDVPDKNGMNSLFGKNKKMDHLIVMDEVSGVAEQFQENSDLIAFMFFTLLLLLHKFGKK